MTTYNGQIDRWTGILREEGWCIIPEALPLQTIESLDADLAERFKLTPYCQGGFYGESTKRFGRLLSRSVHTATLVQHEIIMGVVTNLLSPWCDTIQLNVTQAIGVHPGAPAQLPHRDQDMWAGPKGETEYLVNVIWPLTEFSSDNGATMVWPRTHGAKALETVPSAEPISAIMAPGSALVFLGSTLHGAGENRSSSIRRGLVVGYALGWLKPYENQWLSYPPAIARRFSPDLAALVGYQQHRPNLGNFEGRCPSLLLGDDLPGYIGAADALRPDQEALIVSHIADRHRAS